MKGPTGLGTSAARLRPPGASAAAGGRTGALPVPPLHCPDVLRDDPALGAEVNDRLVDWAEEVGIHAGRLDSLRVADFGRLMMLAHPGTDDPDLLLAIGRCTVAAWTADDYYCDDRGAGAVPELAAARMAIAATVLDPASFPAAYAPDLRRAIRSDPVLVALRSAREHLGRYATPTQVARACREQLSMFQAASAEAVWRCTGRMPSVWEYLVHRQLGSQAPILALVDAGECYRLPTRAYTDPQVRRAFLKAALASALVNDLYSMARENAGPDQDFNLPVVIAAEDGCTLAEALARSAAVHDELMRDFEASAASLSRLGPPELARFLAGVHAWLAGNRAWHAGSARYATTPAY
ncbi:family 2 encapsulin nanocompartment cargo protein terpene cyclase [Streptomyces lasiicapitis]|uniref:family 2 encapsulin nanocompartment cargo protein terpene cyclase n=1 Tax=Streptomyces lasiicapitis TaxID=1923961 RepID=UPI00366A0836